MGRILQISRSVGVCYVTLAPQSCRCLSTSVKRRNPQHWESHRTAYVKYAILISLFKDLYAVGYTALRIMVRKWPALKRYITAQRSFVVYFVTGGSRSYLWVHLTTGIRSEPPSTSSKSNRFVVVQMQQPRPSLCPPFRRNRPDKESMGWAFPKDFTTQCFS